MIKRVYDRYDISDGFRVLVDRLWPRGISKEKAHIDEWAKSIAPSTGIRKEFNHEDDKWDKFKRGYEKELEENPALDEFIKIVKNKKIVTLIYGAKDNEHNNAIVLREFLNKKLSL